MNSISMKTYRPYDPSRMFLLPPALQDWLPKGHLVYFILDLMKSLDLSAIYADYEKELRGYPNQIPPASISG